ncbi:hypothetical protein ACIGFK_17675 [Streptomyces sp. NPDC085524]|uniref:hypothetical protein n=1 Tax=unclassified Streptomyces TaxID=2593676 RepID=UPI0036C59945
MPDAATASSSSSSYPPSPPPGPDADLLDALCRALAEAADAVGEAARDASALALGRRLSAAALARGGARRLGWRTLLRTLTDPAGLGWAPRGRGVAGVGRIAGVLTGRESLAISIAVCGLRARIRAAGTSCPELLADPGAAAVLTAVREGRQADAVRLFRRIVRDQGAEHAFALLSPYFADILAWSALTDVNPFNDHAGWQVATGRAQTAEPLLGLGAAFLAFCDRGRGLSERPAGRSAEPAARPASRPYARQPAWLSAVQPARSRQYAARRRAAAQLPRRAPRPVSGGPPGLCDHAAALRSHAVRLRATAAAPGWHGPGTDALRAEVAGLADRCTTAADGLALAAVQLQDGLQDG